MHLKSYWTVALLQKIKMYHKFLPYFFFISAEAWRSSMELFKAKWISLIVEFCPIDMALIWLHFSFYFIFYSMIITVIQVALHFYDQVFYLFWLLSETLLTAWKFFYKISVHTSPFSIRHIDEVCPQAIDMAILEPIKIHQNFERLKLIVQHKRELINLPPCPRLGEG